MPGSFGDYCLETVASRVDRFALHGEPAVNYAYHLDAALYAKFLRARSGAAASSVSKAGFSR